MRSRYPGPAELCFESAADDGHSLRLVARALALHSINAGRGDAEGAQAVDLEGQSNPVWVRWKRNLRFPHSSFLRIWRGGAVKTRTRRWYGQEAYTQCSCGAASALHLFSQCPQLEAKRASLSRRFGIPREWWAAQPRVTSKSGWIIRGAGVDEASRVQRQIAACELGVAIVQMLTC